MVLPLTSDEESRMRLAIAEFSESMRLVKHPSVRYIGRGYAKGVFAVQSSDETPVAAACARDGDVSLEEECRILHRLHRAVPHLFPESFGVYNSMTLGQVMVMELLDHDSMIHPVDLRGVEDPYRKLAYQIGSGIAEVFVLTGMYSSEPHKGNILVKNADGVLDIKFCDAIQWKHGSLEEGIHAILRMPDEREECFRFIHRFRQGIIDKTHELTGISQNDLASQLDFMRSYNPIF